MKKIPVGQTIAHGYRFGVGRFLDLFRLLWLPSAGAAICAYFTGDQMTLLMQSLRSHDFSHLTLPWPLILLLTVFSFLCANMQITAAYQLALDRVEARGRWFYFPLGKPLWQVIGAFLVLMLTLGALLVVYLLAVLLIGIVFGLGFHAAHMSDEAIKTVTALDAALAFVVGYCGFIFCTLRFGFLLFTATIAEEKIGLFRAWAVSHGNFWRMFLIGLAVVLPLLVVELCFLAMAGVFHLPPPGATQAQIEAMQAASSAQTAAAIRQYWYLFYPGLSLMMMLIYGLLAGSQAFAYRALTEDTTSNPL